MLPPPRKKSNLVKKTLRYFVFLCTVMGLAGFVLVGVQWFSDSIQDFFGGQVISAATLPASILPPPKTLEINAVTALSLQVADGAILFEKDSQKQLPIASLTKLMTALIVLERYDMQSPVTLDLLHVMLIESSNPAAESLAEMMGQDAFVALMNERAKELGMNHTQFADATGLSSKSQSTAKDIAVLSQYLFEYYPLFREIVSLKEYQGVPSTNKVLGQDGIIGGKTGYTEEAGGCFMAIRKTDQGYTINVVLGAGDRFGAMQKLISIQ